MAQQRRRDESTSLPIAATDEGAAVGATAHVKNAPALHKAPSQQMHMTQGRQRGSKAQFHKPSSSQTSKSSMSEAESNKKRKKLTYTRTSIACAHCRRRKIQCVPDKDDPTAKCGNCVKFKKECLFFPVAQQQVPSSSQGASSSSARRPSSSAASSPTDAKPDEPSHSGYAPTALHVSDSQHEPLHSYSNTSAIAAISVPTLDTSGAMHHTRQADSPWQYQSAFHPNHHSLPLHHQYQQHFAPYMSPTSEGDFSPYPVYSSTTSQYNTTIVQTANVPQRIAASVATPANWPTYSYSQGYMFPTSATSATFSQSAFADPTYYSGQSDSARTGEADAWYSSFSEETYDTPPDVEPYGGRSH